MSRPVALARSSRTATASRMAWATSGVAARLARACSAPMISVVSPKKRGAPRGHDLVVEISHGRVAGDAGGRVGVAALHAEAEVLVPHLLAAQLRGLVHHLAGQLDPLDDGPVGAAVLGGIQDLHPLAARRDLVRQPLGAEARGSRRPGWPRGRSPRPRWGSCRDRSTRGRSAPGRSPSGRSRDRR